MDVHSPAQKKSLIPLDPSTIWVNNPTFDYSWSYIGLYPPCPQFFSVPSAPSAPATHVAIAVALDLVDATGV